MPASDAERKPTARHRLRHRLPVVTFSEGELEHFVNGTSVKLTAGMIGTVRPPDKVRHKTGPNGARALVIWAPAGEAARIASRWKRVEP